MGKLTQSRVTEDDLGEYQSDVLDEFVDEEDYFIDPDDEEPFGPGWYGE